MAWVEIALPAASSPATSPPTREDAQRACSTCSSTRASAWPTLFPRVPGEVTVVLHALADRADLAQPFLPVGAAR